MLREKGGLLLFLAANYRRDGGGWRFSFEISQNIPIFCRRTLIGHHQTMLVNQFGEGAIGFDLLQAAIEFFKQHAGLRIIL